MSTDFSRAIQGLKKDPMSKSSSVQRSDCWHLFSTVKRIQVTFYLSISTAVGYLVLYSMALVFQMNCNRTVQVWKFQNDCFSLKATTADLNIMYSYYKRFDCYGTDVV